MSRLRWAVAVLTGGLGLISGCSTLRDHPWFNRARPAAAPACCDTPGVPIADGPIVEGGPGIVPPPGPLTPGAELQPPGTNGTIRPVPQPQAQPVPAPPTSRRAPGLIIDRWKE